MSDNTKMDFSALTILCIGDIMLDRFIYGNVQRISPEAPVPVLHLNSQKEMLGGVGNVANNILSLNGKAVLVGLVGNDEYALKIKKIMRSKYIPEDSIISSPYRPTICKSRFIAANQQIIRADEESLIPLHSEEITLLIENIEKNIPSVQAVIISDYGKGVCHPEIIQFITQRAKHYSLPVFVDPKSRDFSLYRHATCITPNIAEASQAVQMSLKTDTDFEKAGQELLDITQGQAILITRSEKGMTLVEKNRNIQHIPSRAREVFDVSGAGDTVIATLALGVASGLCIRESMHIANAAAGVVIGKAGTSTATIAEVQNELKAQSSEETFPLVTPELISLNDLTLQVNKWKKQGLTIGFTNGCFDILHTGHISLLQSARTQCDRLIVALNSDTSIQRLKGPKRPINPLKERARLISAIRYVDAVVAFDDDTPLNLIQHIKPDILIKGADYIGKEVVGQNIVEQYNGKVILTELQKGFSTTNIIDKIKHL